MAGRWWRLVLVLGLGIPGPSMLHAEPAAALASGGRAQVVEVLDGDTVRLDDGRRVRLAGVTAPRPARAPAESSSAPPAVPLAAEARAALNELVAGRAVALRFGGAREDRHGRVLAQLTRDDGLWVQGEMLGQGWARVQTFADNRARAAEMLAREAEARAAGRGLWAHPAYAVRTPDSVAADVDSFQLVEGRVVKAAAVREQVFLNFGADWKTDFTVSIGNEALRRFRRAGLDPLTLEGRTVLVRGWVVSRNGPMIEATHPEQVQLPPPDEKHLQE